MLRSSDFATTNVFCTMDRSGITIVMNNRISVKNTIMLNGLPITFKNWFLNRFLVIGGRSHPFFAIF